MPKVVVLFLGAESEDLSFAETLADGARSVRFTEVDVRAADGSAITSSPSRKQLESIESVRAHDGIIIASRSAGALTPELERLLTDLARVAPANAWMNTVFAVASPGNGDLLARVTSLGGIVVSEPHVNGSSADRLRAHGARTAKVVAWVRHALGHEQAHEQAHPNAKPSHSHEHGR